MILLKGWRILIMSLDYFHKISNLLKQNFFMCVELQM